MVSRSGTYLHMRTWKDRADYRAQIIFAEACPHGLLCPALDHVRHVVSTIDPDARDMASPEEAAAELAAMSHADLIRLEHFARLRTVGLTWVDWEDLLHEAIDRVLGGSRKWPRSVPFVAFMCGTMRSIASEYWRHRTTKRGITISELRVASNRDAEALDQIVDEHSNPEREVIARELLKRIESLFEGDTDALAILTGLANGDTPDEIRRSAKMTAKKYATAQKRIRRRISRFLRETQV